MKTFNCGKIPIGLLILLYSLSFGVQASIVIDGSLIRTGGNSVGSQNGWSIGADVVQHSVDQIYFNVNTNGIVTLDVLSWENSGFLSGLPTDVNGDGETAFFDSMIRLFHDDGIFGCS